MTEMASVNDYIAGKVPFHRDSDIAIEQKCQLCERLVIATGEATSQPRAQSECMGMEPLLLLGIALPKLLGCVFCKDME